MDLLISAVGIVLGFGLDVLKDTVVQHLVAVAAVGYMGAHAFSRTFRHDVTVAEQGVVAKLSAIFTPFKRVIGAVREGFQGAVAGAKGESITVVVPAPKVPVSVPSAATAASKTEAK